MRIKRILSLEDLNEFSQPCILKTVYNAYATNYVETTHRFRL